MKFYVAKYEIRDGFNEYQQTLLIEADSLSKAEKQLNEALTIGESENDSQAYVAGTITVIDKIQFDVLKQFINTL